VSRSSVAYVVTRRLASKAYNLPLVAFAADGNRFEQPHGPWVSRSLIALRAIPGPRDVTDRKHGQDNSHQSRASEILPQAVRYAPVTLPCLQ